MSYNNTIHEISKEDMKLLAKGIEGFIELLDEIIVIPKELVDKHEKSIKEAIEISKKGIKKLKKGDKSVFKDEEDWEEL